MKRNLYFILFLFSISQCACASEGNINEAYSRCILDIGKAKEVILVDDDFVASVIDGDLSLEKVRRKYSTANIEITEIINRHDSTIKDQILVINAGEDYFSYYKYKDRSFPLCVSIRTESFEFDSGIGVGQSISIIKEKFKIKVPVDILVIQELEGGNVVRLYFDKKGRLVRVIVRAEFIG